MNTAHVALLSGALAAGIAWTSAARAATPADQAAAEVLFNEAKQLSATGRYELACPKFVESQRLDPTAGTLLNVGNCYERLGKLASAWGAFKEAEMMARNAGDTARGAEAVRRAEALAPRLPKLVIVVPPAARVPGFEVTRDGALVGEGQWGSALPVDAGEHAVEVSAPGRQRWTTKVQVPPSGASVTVNVPDLLPENVKNPPAGGAAWGAQRIAGVTVGAAGVVGLIMGALFGAQAISKNKDSKQNCSPTDPNFCNDTGVAVRFEAQKWASASTAGIVIGGAALAGGIVLFATAPSAKQPDAARIEIAPRLGGLTLQGSF
jgi:serine/threonine-protein kinase